MNVVEIKAALVEKHGDGIVSAIGQTLFDQDYFKWDEADLKEKYSYTFDDAGFTDGEYRFDFVESYGGEDMGSSYWSVFELKKEGTDESVYVRLDGWYQSYHGSECDDYEAWNQVQKKSVETFVYE